MVDLLSAFISRGGSELGHGCFCTVAWPTPSRAPWWVVASKPSSSLAFAKSKAPVQTDRTSSVS
jgi:hypothetical protein